METRQPTVVDPLPFEEPLARRFLPAFTALVEDLSEGRLLSYSFGFEGQCGNQGGVDPESLSRAVRQQFGTLDWPLEDPAKLSNGDVLKLVEFFEPTVTVPDGSPCGWCDGYHITTGDSTAGAEIYATRVNAIFSSLGLPFRVRNHRVVRDRSALLSHVVVGTELFTNDAQLAKLIETAAANFFDPHHDRRLAGLQAIVNAFERVKSLLDIDKRRSVEKLVSALAPEPQLTSNFNDLLRSLTDIGNRYSIRHHEPAQVPLVDVEVVEFLFFAYFNLVRFALRRLEASEHERPNSG